MMMKMDKILFLNSSERKGKGKQNLCFNSLRQPDTFCCIYHLLPFHAIRSGLNSSDFFIYSALVLFEIMRSKMLFIVFCRIDYFYNEFMFFAKLWFLEY